MAPKPKAPTCVRIHENDLREIDAAARKLRATRTKVIVDGTMAYVRRVLKKSA